MAVVFIDAEPEFAEAGEHCELCEDNYDGTAAVCGSECACRVNVCPGCREWMESRFKCPFTGSL